MQRPAAESRPLVGGVESIEDPGTGPRGGDWDRDEAILLLLRQKLKGRNASVEDASTPKAPARKASPSEEDKYEPQRISRKICWQYDSNAKRVPLLRRHYI